MCIVHDVCISKCSFVCRNRQLLYSSSLKMLILQVLHSEMCYTNLKSCYVLTCHCDGFILFIVIALCLVKAAVDLCEDPTIEGVTESLQQGVVPRGIVNAGNYTYDRTADSVVKCVASCCLSSTCEVHYSTLLYLH